MNTIFRNCVVLLFAALIVQGCASVPVRNTTEGLMAAGNKFFSEGKYEKAIEEWKKVKEKYPPSDVAAKVEISIADAYYLNKEYIESAAEYEGFRKLYPRHPSAEYALYRQAMSNYNQIKGIDTDQVPVTNSLILFESYQNQYPAGAHKAEVLDRLNDCKDKQLQYELYVGKFYLKTGKITSAIGRFEYALKMFPEKQRRDETLFYLGKAYQEGAQKDKSRETFETLVKDFPESVFAKEARTILGKGQ